MLVGDDGQQRRRVRHGVTHDLHRQDSGIRDPDSAFKVLPDGPLVTFASITQMHPVEYPNPRDSSCHSRIKEGGELAPRAGITGASGSVSGASARRSTHGRGAPVQHGERRCHKHA